ncbi:DUF433 domain-containing protein [Hanamia caeni]|jgi:uncharacterized protein (DUF433 family)|uniref:DUF433 domain-containing protein n=1 Tax=Hanamia caeni TaxID=2294116 RepID=A0A3M9NMC3_9BACT|nr:DUF433 domain-containing protein [Hanamia caeni]RNI38932.1 DUF433 domain-containing protein [Hanamia caeni]
MDTTLLNRITTNPSILTGKPVIRGMRISVEQILKMLSRGISHRDILNEYPLLEEDDIRACLLFAASKISNEEIPA